ncbi:hypothetical protein GN958_ATG08084 [Phytophthora infestans]|uniref:Uncharacterized protein n=1 Tax=Phytophthora infestans TaxID=4787 RepID=A0A8S9UU10_PHYIN|nr:hypothetical protein GN958_ATG08084 [Phytophthora infestans]
MERTSRTKGSFEASILRFVQAAREEPEKEVASGHTAAEDDMKPVSGQGHVKATDGATEITVENGTTNANNAIRDAVLHKGNLNETNQELSLRSGSERKHTKNGFIPRSTSQK